MLCYILVTLKRDEVRDAFGDLASLIWAPVVKEPVVHDGSAGADTLITDLSDRLRHCLTLE